MMNVIPIQDFDPDALLELYQVEQKKFIVERDDISEVSKMDQKRLIRVKIAKAALPMDLLTVAAKTIKVGPDDTEDTVRLFIQELKKQVVHDCILRLKNVTAAEDPEKFYIYERLNEFCFWKKYPKQEAYDVIAHYFLRLYKIVSIEMAELVDE